MNRNLGLHLDRLPVQIVRAITPLLDGFEGSLDQQGMATKNLEVIDLALAIDYGMQQYGSLNARLLGERRIFRLYPMNEKTLHALGDAGRVIRGRRVRRGKRRSRACTNPIPKRTA